ncbi:helix-turn-helix transcriptional regulator [Novosphingobium sp. KCTC 2891]|uniref:helix-turn-helix transcriptional regulator n=1 Tax=Novosphingobium sp. KCTC 2891 TaxID=2989730 RepID=UPI002221D829|nr:helix-turn-helix transcriptional regulator [Novosphingobium sp. KCTC 2891]MCW1382891.1 helix-turn-helix transcriptional regulator [Novosphingobium sp. KCTC 2891]
MRTPAPGETDLLVPLHEGIFEQPMWQTFLARLRSASGADHAAIVLRSSAGEDEAEFGAGPVSLRLAGLFEDHPPEDAPAMRQMREGRVYALGEIVEAAGAERAGVLADAGLTDLRAVRVQEPGGLDGWLAIAGKRALGAAEGRLLALLVPHFRTALRTFAALERERVRASVSVDAFRRMNFGWITLDARCCVIDMDPQAERLLSRTTLLRKGHYGRLLPAAPEVDRELTALVRRMAEDPDARPRGLHLSRDPWIDMLVAPVRVRAMAGGGQPVAVAYLSGDRTSSADRCDQLAELFGLTGSEARLAWAMAQGLSIAEAAADVGLTVETARNYSKRIYAKTGARGQADLVRHILTSVLALA